MVDDYILLLAMIFAAWATMYGASVALSKIAILLLFVRVFTTTSRNFTVTVWIIGAFVGATGLATIFGSIFPCTPIGYNWDKTGPGRCIDELEFARSMAALNVITGLATLLLPLPKVWRLNVDLSQKIALTATFLHGIMSILSIIPRKQIALTPCQWRDRKYRTACASFQPAGYPQHRVLGHPMDDMDTRRTCQLRHRSMFADLTTDPNALVASFLLRSHQ
ncbi:MAG: hypothetical protein Q9169_006013 [Polycauliona sp. 2 TL-2023]